MTYCKMVRKVFETQNFTLDFENVCFQAEANDYRFLLFNGDIWFHLINNGVWVKTGLTLEDLET